MRTNPPHAPIAIDIISVDSGHCVAAYRHVLLLSWRQQVSVASLHAVRAAHVSLMRKYPEGIGSLTIGNGTYLDEGALLEAASLVRDTHQNVRWAACVIQDRGFIASSARAGLTTLLSIAGHSSMVKVFSNLPAALAWQCVHASGLGLPGRQLAEAAHLVEDAMVARAQTA